MEKKYVNSNSESVAVEFSVRITNSMLYDRLHILSAEYSVPVEFLVNTAIERLINDVDFIRNLRKRK